MSMNTQNEYCCHIFTLVPNEELKFEVDERSGIIDIVLKTGCAESFGSEFIKNKRYTFDFGASVVIFTWHGCTLKVYGRRVVGQQLNPPPMTFYSNFHKIIDSTLRQSGIENICGPIIMVVGPPHAGKSTLCKMLLNYSVQMDAFRPPMYVDLDPSHGQISLQGTIGAAVINKTCEPNKNFSFLDPLVYHFGHLGIKDNSGLYAALITRMGKVILQMMKANPLRLIINTSSWVMDQGYEHLIHIARCFEVDIITVLHQKDLFQEFVRDMPNYIRIIRLPKHPGVKIIGKKTRSKIREAQIQEYFYGSPRSVLHPYTLKVKFSDIKIYRLGNWQILSSEGPYELESDYFQSKFKPAKPGTGMISHLLAAALTSVVKDIVRVSMFGFVCVTNIDTTRNIITLLSTHSEHTPNTMYLISGVQFMNQTT